MLIFWATRDNIVMDKLVKLYVDKVMSRYRIPLFMVSGCDSRIVSNFWKKFERELSIRMNLSTAYYPLMDG